MQLPQVQYSRSNEYQKIQTKRSKTLKYGVPVLALLGIATVVYKCYPNESSTVENINEIDGETRDMLMAMYGDEFDEDLTQLAGFTKDCNEAYTSKFSGSGDQFANIEYISSGYDIFKADPNAEETDRGFKSDLYSLNWGKVKQYSNQVFYPSELQVRREVACQAQVSASIMNDEKELQESLKNEVNIGGGGSYAGFEASFTASSGFKQDSRSYEQNERGMARAKAECSIYSANTIIPPCMSESLILIMEMMDDQPTEAQMNEFFSEFGTHSVKRLRFGGKFVSETSYSKMQRNSELKKGRDLAFSAEASGWGFSANAGASHSSSNDQSFKRDAQMGRGKYWTIGSKLPEGATTEVQLQNWIKNQGQIEKDALPIGEKEIHPLWTTIRKSLQIRNQLTGALENKLRALESHALGGKYCQHLKATNQIQSCNLPNQRDMGPAPAREYQLRYTDWAVNNRNGHDKPKIDLNHKTYIMVQDQSGYGVVDIGFSTNNDHWERSTNNNNGGTHKRTINGPIVGMSLKEQYNFGIIDVEFRFVDPNGHVRSTGWFVGNNNQNRILHINPPKEHAYATIFQAREQGGFGIIDGRLGYQVPI